jgi:hypothetical protein
MTVEILFIILIIATFITMLWGNKNENKSRIGEYLSYYIFVNEIGDIQCPLQIKNLKVMYHLSVECYDDDPLRKCIFELNNKLIHIYGFEFKYKQNVEVDYLLQNYERGSYIILYNSYYYIAIKKYHQTFLINISNKPKYM